MKIQSSSPQTRNFDIKGQDGVYDLQRVYLRYFSEQTHSKKLLSRIFKTCKCITLYLGISFKLH